MSITQPQASGSTPSAPPPPMHHASFVFDASLSRESFLRLIEAQGVVHKLVMRLIEKHGGESQVRLALVINGFSRSGFRLSSHTEPSTTLGEGYASPHSFLTSLPSMARRFTAVGREGAALDRKWPAFSDGQSNRFSGVGGNKRKRIDDGELLEGVVRGFEVLTGRDVCRLPRSPAQHFSSLTPADAAPLLEEMYTPSTASTPGPNTPSQYLLLFAGSDREKGTDDIKSEPLADDGVALQSNWDSSLDGTGWSSIGAQLKDKDVKCSTIVNQGDESRRKRLKQLCDESSGGSEDDLWFTPPPDTEVHLAGCALETDGANSPALANVPTGASDNIVTPTPSTSLLDTSSIPSSAKPLSQSQTAAQQQGMAALRALTQQLANRGNNNSIPPQVLQNLLMAIKSGTLDPNHPATQQIKALLTLQQTQKQSQATLNPAAAAAAAQQAASALQQAQQQQQQQQLQQLQLQAGQVPQIQQVSQPSQPSQPQQQAQQLQQAQQQLQQQVPQAQQQPKIPPKLWSGNIVWAVGQNGQPAKNFLNVDAMLFSPGNPADLKQIGTWPQELHMTQATRMNIPELQGYARANRTPCICFLPAQGNQDQGNLARYRSFVNGLQEKGNMAVLSIGGPDRGVVLFAGPQQQNTTARLMGVVCQSVPIPQLKRPQAPSQPQSQSQPQIQQQPLQQPQPQQQQQAQQAAMPQQMQPKAQFQQSQNRPMPQFTQQPQQQPVYQQAPPMQQQQLQQGQQIQPSPAQLQQQQRAQFLQQQQAVPVAQAAPLQQQASAYPQASTTNYQPPTQQYLQQLQNQAMQAQQQAQALSYQHQTQGAPPPLRFSHEQIQNIRLKAQQSGINLPDAFDPNNLDDAKLKQILGVIKEAEARRKLQMNPAAGMMGAGAGAGAGVGAGGGQLPPGINPAMLAQMGLGQPAAGAGGYSGMQMGYGGTQQQPMGGYNMPH